MIIAETGITARLAPIRRRDVVVHEIDGEALVADPLSGDTHRLNETAFFIWRLCDGQLGQDLIAERLAESYEVDVDEAREHVTRILAVFEAAGLTTADAIRLDGN